MILPELKQDVLSIAEIANECPENFRERCFELLLVHYLEQFKSQQAELPKTEKPNKDVSTTSELNGKPPDIETLNGHQAPPESDLALKDLHVKAKRFLEKAGLNLTDLNQIFYKADEGILPLYEDLKTTKASESQIRIGLLQALASGIKTGEFEFDGEDVRKECQTRKCYDVGNFSANFKNNANLFDGFEKYEKQQPIIKLSEEGRKALAKAISELR